MMEVGVAFGKASFKESEQKNVAADLLEKPVMDKPAKVRMTNDGCGISN